MNFSVNVCGPVFALARMQENMFEEFILKYLFTPLPALLVDIVAVCAHTHIPEPMHESIYGELLSARMHATPVFAWHTQANTGYISWGSIYALVFVPGGGPVDGGVQTGGVSRFGLIPLDCSFDNC